MKQIFIVSLLFLFCTASLEAKYSPYLKEWKASRYVPEVSAEEHYSMAIRFYSEKKWKEALPHFLAISLHLEEASCYADALYYAAICYYFQGELELANRYFSSYLESKGSLEHFEKALEFKYYIADHYLKGRKKHLFSRKYMPTLLGTSNDAIAIYDEVIAALANKELAVRALFGKATILRKQRLYDESVEVFKTLVHRHEVHELAEQSLLQISEIYVERAYGEAQDPDLLALAELNLRSFHKHFPSSPLIETAEANVRLMQEIFAKSLMDTALLYERKKKPHAAKIYLQELVTRYPHTEVAKLGIEKMNAM